MLWTSTYTEVSNIEFPSFNGTRVIMMPFRLEAVKQTLPSYVNRYASFIEYAIKDWFKEGIAYLTIDELAVKKDYYHRRSGLHVDGWWNEGMKVRGGLWGGGGLWGKGGMLLASNYCGSVVYNNSFDGEPKIYGNCEHLREQCSEPIKLSANKLYSLTGMSVHETIPVDRDIERQFIRISGPNKGAWPKSCTPNPLGILPEGPIVEKRPIEFITYGGNKN